MLVLVCWLIHTFTYDSIVFRVGELLMFCFFYLFGGFKIIILAIMQAATLTGSR